jgi:hypothetical protein
VKTDCFAGVREKHKPFWSGTKDANNVKTLEIKD